MNGRWGTLLAAVALGSAGCAGGLARAEAEFADGHYPAAQQTLAGLEVQSRAWDDARRAEYALFRGLTHSALGDREQGASWLREARAIEDAHPGSLSRENAQRLKLGMENGD